MTIATGRFRAALCAWNDRLHAIRAFPVAVYTMQHSGSAVPGPAVPDKYASFPVGAEAERPQRAGAVRMHERTSAGAGAVLSGLQHTRDLGGAIHFRGHRVVGS